MWAIVERSGRFWVVVHGKEKWKKVNEVRYLMKRGHDTSIGSVAPRQPYIPHSDPAESAEIADAFRRLVLHSPTQLGREQAETVFEVSVPDTRVARDEDGA